MTQGYAKITGRIVGPEGLGRMGSVQFLPNHQYQAVEEDGTRDVLLHYAAARLAPDGRLVDMAGVPGAKVAAPTSLPAGVPQLHCHPRDPRRYGGVAPIPGPPPSRHYHGSH